MIESYIGLPGTGKTLGATFRVCEALKNKKRVFSNTPITDTIFKTGKSAEKFETLEQMLNIDNALIFIDEANILLNSRLFMKTPIEVLTKLAQVRKYGLDLIYTTQGFRHAEKRLRDLTNYIWDSHKLGRENNPIGFRYDLYDPEDFELRTPKIYRKRLKCYFLFKHMKYNPMFGVGIKFKLLKNLYKSFDTKFII